jgi:transposase
MTTAASKAITVTAAQAATAAALLRRRELTPRLRERAVLVTAAAQGPDVASIASWSSRSPRTVRRWLRRFLQQGVAALSDAPRAGRPQRADPAYLQALETAVTTAPPALDLPFDVWTSARLSAYLTETTGTRIAPGWLRALLARRQIACGRPKHTLTHLQDAVAVATCAEDLAVAERKSAG